MNKMVLIKVFFLFFCTFLWYSLDQTIQPGI